MSDLPDARRRASSPDVVQRVAQVCDRFEGSWNAGLEPRIEDYLRDWHEPGDAELLQRLLELEIDHRRRTEKAPTPEEYKSRFPEYADVVERAFLHTGGATGSGDTLAPTELVTGEAAHPAAAEGVVRRGGKFGRFELRALLGKGAYGSVYRAHDPLLDRDVALKIPHVSDFSDDEHVERFLREARAAAQLRHSNIVPVHETGKIDKTYFIVSDFIDGETLRCHLARNPKLAHAEAAALVMKLARALHYAHEKGVIHRDVKPENIMLGRDGEPQIADFGLARREHDEVLQTREGTRMGTPAYMSPEQAKGQSHLVDGRSDLWSLGVILYELLTGQRPFTGGQTDVLVALVEKEPKWPRKHDRSIPRDLETICMRCLAKDPGGRYRSCQELAVDLERFRLGEPILARRLSPMARAWRKMRRRPIVSGLIGASLLAMAVGGYFAVLGQTDRRRAEHDRQVAELLGDLDRRFAAKDWSAGSVAGMDGVIERLEHGMSEIGPAENAREKLVESLAAAIRDEFGRANLRPDDIARIEAWLAVLADRDAARADQLNAEYERRLWKWENLFDLAPPFAGLDATLEPTDVRMEADRLIRIDKPTLTEIVYSRVPSPGRVALEAVFDASWENVGAIGLLVDAEGGHVGQPTALAVSPDGKILASGDDQGTLKLWDLQTGRVTTTLGRHRSKVKSITFFPDNQTLATAGGDLFLWDLAAHARRADQPKLSGGSNLVAVSADGTMLAAAGGVARLWDVASAEARGAVREETGHITHIAFSPAGNLLATAGLKGNVILHDPAGQLEERELAAAGGELCALAFSFDGNTLATARFDAPGVQLWDVASGVPAGRCFEQWHIAALAFAPDRSRLAAASVGREVGVYDPETGISRTLQPDSDPRAESVVLAMALAPETGALLTAHESGAIVQWNVAEARVERVFGNRGYLFLVRAPSGSQDAAADRPVSSESSFADLRGTDAPLTIQILRDRTELQQETVPISLLPPGPLRLKATKIESGLSFEVGDLPPVEFVDPFSYVAKTPGVFAAHWPVGVSLSRLRATRQALPETPSLLEQGDFLYSQGRFDDALEAYRQQAKSYRTAEASQQARYKAASCLLSLDRESEAEPILKELAGETGQHWPVLSACRLWHLWLRRDRFDEADALIEDFSARARLGEIGEISRLVPSEIRTEIVYAYKNQSKGLNFYKPSPDLIRRCQRALDVAHLLGMPTSRGSSGDLEKALIRAHRARGDEEEALRLAEKFVRDADPGEMSGVVVEYSWMLRLIGQPAQALKALDRWIARRPADASPDPSVALERVRVLVALQRWDDAETELEELLQAIAPGSYTWRRMRWEYTSAHALLGVIREHRGDNAGAREAWKQGLSSDWTDTRYGFRCVDGLILASLTGELSDADAQAFMNQVLKPLTGDSPVLVFAGQLSGSLVRPKTAAPVLRNSFRSPRGRQYAEKIILRQISFAECVRVPAMLVYCEFARQGAMTGKLTDEQDALLWNLADRGFVALCQTGAIDALMMFRLGLAWTGNAVGWKWAASRLDPDLRGPSAYVMGHRYLRLGRADDAAMLFREALEDAPSGSSLETLAQAELDRLGGAENKPPPHEE